MTFRPIHTALIVLLFALSASGANFTKPTTPALVSTNPLATGLVRVVTFSEGTGSTLHDYSTLTANLTTRQSGATTALTWTTGDATVGTYATFNGTNQDAVGVDTGLVSGYGDRTMSFLFKTTSSATATLGAYGTTGAGQMGTFLLNSGSNAQFGVSTASSGAFTTGGYNDGNWHVGTIVLSGGTGTVDPLASIYVDGAFVTSAQYAISGTVRTVTGGSFYLSNRAGTGLYFSGQMAGAWMWNIALTPTQVASHASAPFQMVGGPQPAGNSFASTQSGNWSDLTGTGPWGVLTVYPWQKQALSNAVASPNGAIRLTLAGAAIGPNPGWASGYLAYVENVGGTVEANAPGGTVVSKRWAVNAIDAVTLDLKPAYIAAHATVGTANRTGDTAPTNIKATGSDGAGGIRITIAGTAAPAGTAGAYAAGQTVTIAGVGTDVNGTWKINAVAFGTDTTFDLASVFTNTYTAATGTISRNDTVTISAGTNVVADATVQGGDDINSATGIAISGATATLTIGSGATVTARTIIGIGGGTIALQKNSTLLIGASVNGPVWIDTGGNTSMIKTTTDSTIPTANNRATLSFPPYPAIASNRWYAREYHDCQQFNMAYANITGGTASVPLATRDSFLAGGYHSFWQFDHVTFTGCGSIGSNNQEATRGDASGTYSFTNCSWKGSLNSPIFWNSSVNRTGAATTRQIKSCYFDGAPTFNGGMWGTTVEDTVFNNIWGLTGINPAGDVTSFARNLIRSSVNTFNGYNVPGSMTDCYHLNTEVGANNPFAAVLPPTFGATITGNTWDGPFFRGDGQGDCFYINFAASGATTNHVLSYNLILPIAIGWSGDSYLGKRTMVGNLCSGRPFPAGNVTVKFDHNTACVRTTSLTGTVFASGNNISSFLNEGAATPSDCSAAGTIPQLQNSLYWDDASVTSGNYAWACWLGNSAGLGTTNTVTPTGVRNNAYFNMKPATSATYGTGTNVGTPYACPMTGAIPGFVGGVNTDVYLTSSPNFIDPTRSFVTWSRTQILGLSGRTDAQGPTDVESMMTVFSQMNDDSGANAGASVAALNTWVRAGWKPRNPALKAAGTAGSDIGAMPVQVGIRLPILLDMLRRRRADAAPLPATPIIDDRRRSPIRKAA